MLDFHGIIFAYRTTPALGELVSRRTAASLPFCGRYRLINFPLSSLMNAGVRDVGVIMQRDYQSLLDHLGSGKPWDMSRKDRGLRILPPFGLPEYHTGNYAGTMEALNAVSLYVRDIPQKHVVLLLGDLVANIDLRPIFEQHLHSGAAITAICSDRNPQATRHRFVLGEDGFVKEALYDVGAEGEGLASLEGYVIEKETLLHLMDACRAKNFYRFHRDGIGMFLAEGGKMDVAVHKGYAEIIRSVEGYYQASRDTLEAEVRRQLFPAERPVRTKNHEGVSTYYGEHAVSKNSLVADNCIVEGELENCILFSGVRVGPGAKLKNCILFRNTIIGENAKLDCVVADKECTFKPGTELKGSESLPIVVGKGKQI
ncbi:MAG: glucose-1-phosphate adenylyltransferase subunit GlgD [Oscillospiraceae bacterium]|nr:glucose-1-phosphate adenylyltransferase subunit GlgD [Oscillospiraceae bacterium]